jgi:cobalt-zinc-cadmium efflux system membrane fusion protein
LRVAEAKLQQAESGLKIAQKSSQKERVAVAKAALGVAEVQRDLAKFRLDSTEIRAPASGTILTKHVQVGESVRPDALVNGRPFSICEIADLSQLDAMVEVPEKELARVFQGQKCEIRLPAVPDVVYRGQVARVPPTVSEQTRTARVRVRLEKLKDDRNTRPGMYAEVRLLAKE